MSDTGAAFNVGTAYTVGFSVQWGYYTDPGTRQNTADSGFVLCTNRWYDLVNTGG